MKAFVTGGTGFIGRRVIEKLIARGYQVQALVRSHVGAQAVQALGAHAVWGDVSDLVSLRSAPVTAALQGSDVAFHIAAWYKIGAPDWELAEAINVEGTRNVLSLAHELGIPKIIYTSTVAVFGDTYGQMVDEQYHMPPGPFLTEYDRTKWMAHYQVAVPLIRQGAPIVIIMPSAVYGPGDTSLAAELMRLFWRGLLPVLPGPELTLAYVYIDDVAEGHVLAAEKGRIGESYILAGPVFTMGEMVKVWASIAGRRPPLFSIPGKWLAPLAPLMGAVNALLPLPPMLSRDATAILTATYIASSEKAMRELGWRLLPLKEGMQRTFAALAQEPAGAETALQRFTPGTKRAAAAIIAGVAVGLLTIWLLNRKSGPRKVSTIWNMKNAK